MSRTFGFSSRATSRPSSCPGVAKIQAQCGMPSASPMRCTSVCRISSGRKATAISWKMSNSREVWYVSDIARSASAAPITRAWRRAASSGRWIGPESTSAAPAPSTRTIASRSAALSTTTTGSPVGAECREHLEGAQGVEVAGRHQQQHVRPPGDRGTQIDLPDLEPRPDERALEPVRALSPRPPPEPAAGAALPGSVGCRPGESVTGSSSSPIRVTTE